MEPLNRILEALSGVGQHLHFDPSGWVALHQRIPISIAGVMVGAGLLACFFGSGRIAFRFVLAPLAAGLGYLIGPQFAGTLHLTSAAAQVTGAAVLGFVALLFPPALLFAAAGLGGAVIGGELAGSADYWAGAVPGLVLAGVFALALFRFIAVALSSIAGAATFTLGAITLLSLSRFAGLATRFPTLAVAFAGMMAVAAMVYQFKFTPTDEEREKRRAEKTRAKELAADEKRREKRFKNYDKRASQ